MNPSAQIASIAVARPVGRLLDYIVPETLDVTVGSRVLLPLGNSRATGLVLALKEGEAHPKLKAVIDTVDAGQLLDPSLVHTLRFAIAWYRAEPSEMVRAALPAGLGVSTVKTLTRVEGVPLPPAFAHLEAALGDGVAARTLAGPEVARLLKSGAAQSETKVVKAKAEPRVEWFRAVIHPDRFPARAKAQKQLLEILYGSGGWLPLKDLPNLRGRRRLLKALLERRAIERREASWLDTHLAAPDEAPTLNDEQQAVVEAITDDGGFAQHLVFGVTGSGKTEVYLQAIAKVLEAGRQALVLVPEIALTPQMVQRFGARFGARIAVLHSALASGARRAAWHRAQRGEAEVVIGARSAVFASMPRLGLIVIDEEHDGSYKQGDGVRYHARDLSIVRCQALDIPVVLGSATPSLESYVRAQSGSFKTRLHRLKNRATGATLPQVELVDLRHRQGAYPLSPELCQAIDATIARGEQVMLLLNRRGWAPSLLCMDCGARVTCAQCSVPMVLHRGRDVVCHWCGNHCAAPKHCPDCSSSALSDAGIGTQQLEAACAARFPKARVARLDSDTARSNRGLQRLIKAMGEGELDLLVGTQMLAKGHDLPGVTLVGVICADQGLRIADPRCAERTFSLLTQVAGRAGRAGRPGRVIFQTFDPDHPAIQAATRHDADGFLAAEMVSRAELELPPFRRAVMVRCAHESADEASLACSMIGRQQHHGVLIFGPVPSAVEKLRGRYRFQLMAISKSASLLQSWMNGIEATVKEARRRGVRVVIDVDPTELI